MRNVLKALQREPRRLPYRGQHHCLDQPQQPDPNTTASVADWVLAELGVWPTPESLTLAQYFAAYWETLGPWHLPAWNENRTRLGMRHGLRKDRHFELGRIVDPGFWTEILPHAPEAREVASPLCLFVNSTHIRYGGFFHIGVRHARADGLPRLLICSYTKRHHWQHFQDRPAHTSDDSFVLALARGVVNPKVALTTRKVTPGPGLAKAEHHVNPAWVNSAYRNDPAYADTELI